MEYRGSRGAESKAQSVRSKQAGSSRQYAAKTRLNEEGGLGIEEED